MQRTSVAFRHAAWALSGNSFRAATNFLHSSQWQRAHLPISSKPCRKLRTTRYPLRPGKGTGFLAEGLGMSAQLELFGRRGKREMLTRSGRPSSQRERRDAQTSQTPTSGTYTDRDPYDFSEPDPRAEPRPEWIPPEWLRLPGVDDPT